MSTSTSPVAADQQVSMRRSASASMASACLGTKRSPRHRSRARRHNNDSSAARRAAGHAHPHAREHGASQVQAAIDVAADQELLGPAPLELDSLRVSGVLRRRAGRRRRPPPVGRRSRARRRILPSMRRRQAMPAPAPTPAHRRTRRGRRRARVPAFAAARPA